MAWLSGLINFAEFQELSKSGPDGANWVVNPSTHVVPKKLFRLFG
jgi:hypothetical protein